MSAPPLTVLAVPEHEAAAIRAAVRAADVALLGPGYRLAVADDVPELLDLLSDPAVSAPIYDLPRPFTAAVIRAWVAEAQARQHDAGQLYLAEDCASYELGTDGVVRQIAA